MGGGNDLPALRARASSRRNGKSPLPCPLPEYQERERFSLASLQEREKLPLVSLRARAVALYSNAKIMEVFDRGQG
jgi:hypothetical protein